MSLLDDFLQDLQPDLEKVQQEEEKQDVVSKEETIKPSPITSSTDNSSSKRPKLMKPTQLIRKKEEIVTSAPPTRFQPPIATNTTTISSRSIQQPRLTVPQPPPPPTFAAYPVPPPLPTVAVPSAASTFANRANLIFQPTVPPAELSKTLTSTSTSGKSITGETITSQDEYKLFVGNLSPEAKEENVQQAFKDYVSIRQIKIIMDHTTEKCKGYAFVYFADPFEMLRALREKNGKLCGNRPMLLSKAKGEHHESKDEKKKATGKRTKQ
jgi:hypothetical protein